MTYPAADPEMQVEEAQPTAAVVDDALVGDWTDLISQGVLDAQAEATPAEEPNDVETDEGQEPEPVAAQVVPEQSAPQLPQTAAEWMAVIDASPGREAQVPAKLRVELRDLREERANARVAAAEARVRQETAGQAEQARQEAMAVAEKVNTYRQIHQLRQEDPTGYIEWQDANPQLDAEYRGYVANMARPPQQAAPQRSEVQVLQSIPRNQELIAALNADTGLTQKVLSKLASGQYGTPGDPRVDGGWTAQTMQAALYDVAAALATPKPDPAARAVEERRAATEARGEIPKPAGGGTPAAAEPKPLPDNVDDLLEMGLAQHFRGPLAKTQAIR